MRVDITANAIERYHRYYCPAETLEQAEKDFRVLVAMSTPTKARSLRGDPLWSADGVRLVVKHDAAIRADVVVDVLPPESTRASRAAEHERASAERDVAKCERELRETKKRLDAASAAHGAADAAHRAAVKRLQEIKEQNHG